MPNAQVYYQIVKPYQYFFILQMIIPIEDNTKIEKQKQRRGTNLQLMLIQNLRHVRIVICTSTNNARRQPKGGYDYAILRRRISSQDYQRHISFIHIQITSNADICSPSSAMRAKVRATHSTLFYGIKGERKHL